LKSIGAKIPYRATHHSEKSCRCQLWVTGDGFAMVGTASIFYFSLSQASSRRWLCLLR
jgi:hypothetical protein